MNRIYSLFILLVLIASFVFPLSAFAQAEAEYLELEGYVTELAEGGFLLEDAAMGSVMLNVDDTTIFDGHIAENGVQAGDYVIVTYDGRLTRSIPPQAHADRVVTYKLSGVVTEWIDETTLSVETPDMGPVWVHVKAPLADVTPGVYITAYYDGIMAMSYPGQIAAREIVVHQLTGAVEGLDVNSFTILTAEDASAAFKVDQSTIISRLEPAAENDDNASETDAAFTETILFPGVMPLTSENAQSDLVPAADEQTDVSPEPASSPAADEETDDEQPASLPYDLSEYLFAGDTVTVSFAPSADDDTLPVAVKILILP